MSQPQNTSPANPTPRSTVQETSPSPARSEGYPSWLPKRPPHPAPASTIQSSTINMLANATSASVPVEPSDVLNEPPPTIPPLWGGRKPTPRSVRIVKTREPTDQTRVSGTPHVWSRATGAGVSPTLVAHGLRPSRPRFRAPGLHLELLRDPSWLSRFHFFLFPFVVFAHIPLQTFFDFNVAFVLVEIAKFPNPVAPGVPGSGNGWALAAAAYVACWAFWIFGIFIGYELIYSFYRRWRYRRPLIMPLYLSAPAFNFVCTSSYTHFCFFQHLRASAIPRRRSRAILPSAEGSWRDALAETFFFYSQNLPTVALLLPRAGITLGVLLTFWNPVELPGGLPLTTVEPNIVLRDGTFFDTETGSLSGYAKGVLAANAAWAAWRILVLLVSWIGLLIFSGFGSVGLCGPATRWEEEEGTRVASVYSEKDVEDGLIPWSWKECTALRIQEAYDFCLTLKRPRSARKERTEGTDGEQAAFEGAERVLAAVGLSGNVQQARRGLLSQELFESPDDTHPEATAAAAEPEARPDPTYPFEGFGVRDEGSREKVPFPPSPDLAGEDSGEDDDGDQSAEPRTSHEVTSSGRASNSLSSLGHPIPGRYPFTFRHPARGSLSSAGAPSGGARSHHTPQSKSTSSNAISTGGSGVSRSTGNVESSDSPSMMGDSSNAPSPVGMSACMPMPPRHPAPRNGRGRAGTVPLPTSPSPAYFPRVRAGTHTTNESVDIEPSIVYESEVEGGVVGSLDLTGEQQRASSVSPSPESVLAMEREEEDSVGLLSPGLSPKTSSSGLRSRHSSNSSRSRTGSSRSRHGSHPSVSSVSLSARGIRARTQSLIQSIGSASRLSVDRSRSRTQSLVRIEDLDERSSKSLERERLGAASPHHENSPYLSEASGGRVSSPENYTFGQRLAGTGARTGRPRAPTVSSEEPRSDAEASVSGSGSGGSQRIQAPPSMVSSLAAQSEQTASVPETPQRRESVQMTAALPVPAATRYPTVREHPSTGMLSAAAPSFVTDPPTIAGHSDSTGRTPSSWGGDDYVHGRNFKPI